MERKPSRSLLLTLMGFRKFVLLVISLGQALFMAFGPHAETFLVTHIGLGSFSLCPLLRRSEVAFPVHQMGRSSHMLGFSGTKPQLSLRLHISSGVWLLVVDFSLNIREATPTPSLMFALKLASLIYASHLFIFC